LLGGGANLNQSTILSTTFSGSLNRLFILIGFTAVYLVLSVLRFGALLRTLETFLPLALYLYLPIS
jgi:hypothetical protein